MSRNLTIQYLYLTAKPRNEMLEAVIEQEFDGDRSAMICFAHWLEFHILGTHRDNENYQIILRRVRRTYNDWMEVQRGGMR